MEWTVLIDNVKDWLCGNEIKVYPPATNKEISDAENTLGVKFPDELVEYLYYSNGIREFMKHPKSDEFIPIDDIIWSVNKIVSETLSHYEYLKEIDVLCKDKYIFFADNGCGEHFGYRFKDDLKDTSIYIYYPIENKYIRVASGLKEWVIGWFSGKIST